MVHERAVAFSKRGIKDSAKLAGLKLAVPMMDLTTLEGMDTPGKQLEKIRELVKAGRHGLLPYLALS